MCSKCKYWEVLVAAAGLFHKFICIQELDPRTKMTSDSFTCWINEINQMLWLILGILFERNTHGLKDKLPKHPSKMIITVSWWVLNQWCAPFILYDAQLV